MRKRLITAFLLLLWLCQLSGRYLVMFEFYLNQEYIAKNLCINRNNPQMHCNGHCQMKKQLSEEEKRNQESPERRVENRSEHFIPSLALELAAPVITISNDYYTPLTIGHPTSLSTSIFHPPGA